MLHLHLAGVPPTGHSADVDTVGNGATKDCAAADC